MHIAPEKYGNFRKKDVLYRTPRRKGKLVITQFSKFEF